MRELKRRADVACGINIGVRGSEPVVHIYALGIVFHAGRFKIESLGIGQAAYRYQNLRSDCFLSRAAPDKMNDLVAIEPLHAGNICLNQESYPFPLKSLGKQRRHVRIFSGKYTGTPREHCDLATQTLERLRQLASNRACSQNYKALGQFRE